MIGMVALSRQDRPPPATPPSHQHNSFHGGRSTEAGISRSKLLHHSVPLVVVYTPNLVDSSIVKLPRRARAARGSIVDVVGTARYCELIIYEPNRALTQRERGQKESVYSIQHQEPSILPSFSLS